MLIKLLCILIIVFSSTSGFAIASKKIIYKPFKEEPALEASLSRSIRQTSLKFLMGLPNYEVILSGGQAPAESIIPVLLVDGSIKEKNKTYSFTLSLLDLKNRTLIRKVSKDSIFKEDLVRMILGGLEALFTPLKEVPKTTEKNTLLNSESIPIVTGVKREKTIDFKERIKNLQSLADMEIKKVQIEKEQVAMKSKKSISPAQIENVTKELRLVSEDNIPSILNKRAPIPKSYKFMGSYETRNIETYSYVRTSSNIAFLNMDFSSHFYTQSKKLGMHFGAQFLRPSKAEVETPNLFVLESGIEANSDSWSIHLKYRMEDLLFYNIEGPGLGLKPGIIKSGWIQLTPSYKIPSKSGYWTLRGSLAKLANASSDWPLLKSMKNFSASSYGLELMLPYIVYNLNFRIMIQSTSFEAQGVLPFKVTDTRLLGGAFYTF